MPVAVQMIRMTATVHLNLTMQLKILAALLANSIDGRPLNFLAINLIELSHLVIDDHLIGQDVDIRIFGVGDKGAPERTQHKFLNEDVLMMANELGDARDGYFIADVDEAQF